MATFGTLSDRLTETFRNLRTKGKLTPADVDGTVREIRRALLDADVALPVVKEFTAKVRERALGDEVNKALNPAQQVLSDQMIDYWAHFVHDAEPGAEWQAFGADKKRLSFQPGGSTVITDYDESHQCAFWASVKG